MTSRSFAGLVIPHGCWKQQGRAMHRLVFAAVAVLAAAFGVAPAAADTNQTLNLGEDISVSVDGVNWKDPIDVEMFLLRVQTAQESDSVAWLDLPSTPSTIRDAVLATVTRPSALQMVDDGMTNATRAEADEMLKTLFGSSAETAAASGWTCGWAYKKVRYRPGYITYYWFSLKTSFCWDGTDVQATPVQEVLGDGSWGWSYEGCVSCYVVGWPAPTAYKSYAKGRMNLGLGIDLNRYPWIQHIVRGDGTVSTTSHDWA